MVAAAATFVPLSLCVLTVSDSRTVADDSSGDYLAGALSEAGHHLAGRALLPDDKYRLRAQVSQWIADPAVDGILVTGGTGFTGRDSTPEALLPLLDKQMPGFGELFRALSFEEIGTSTLQSRAFAGLANGTFLFALPGSTSACRDAWDWILASQLSNVTGGEDGITFRVPELLRPATRLLEQPFLGVTVGGRFATYYLVFGASLALFLALLRVVNSPFGRVLQAIRENEFRAEALGYRIVVYRTLANCLGALVATLAGVLYALWLRYTGPNTTLDFAIMIDILLMVVIGGMGTMYGAVIGATIFVVAQNYLQEAMKAVSGALKGVPVLPDLFHPDRWLLWFGVLFVLSVYYFPAGIVGQLRARAALKK